MTKATKEQFITALMGQESNGGTNPKAFVKNSSGAFGSMQVTEDTFKGLQKQGAIPADWSHTDRTHAEEAGKTLAGQLLDKYQGNVELAAAAYYAGPKAVDSDGRIVNYRDLKNPDAPDVATYSASILKRIGGGDPTTEVTSPYISDEDGIPAGALAAQLSDFGAAMPGGVDKLKKGPKQGKPGVESFVPGPTGLPVPSTTLAQETEAAYAASVAKQADIDKASFAEDLLPAAFRNSSTSWLIGRFGKPDFDDKAVPGYAPTEDSLAGTSSAERSHLLQARSPEEEEYLRSEMAQRRKDEETQSKFGLGANLLAGGLVDAPLDIATGMITLRAFSVAKIGATELARQGRMGAAVLSAAAENVAGSAVLGAARLSSDKFYTTADYGMEVAGAAILGAGLGYPSLRSAAREGAVMREMTRLHEESAAAAVALRERAVKNLPADASEELIGAEIKRLDAEGIKTTITRGTADLPEDRRLLGDVDAEAERIDAEAKAAEVEATSKPESEKPPQSPMFVRNFVEQSDPLTVTKKVNGQDVPVVISSHKGTDLLNAVAHKQGDVLVRQLAGRLMTALGLDDVPVHVVDAKDMPALGYRGSNPRSHYDEGRHMVFLTPDALKNGSEWVITHELAHAATVQKLKAGLQRPDTIEGRIVNDINTLRRQVIKEWEKLGKPDGDGWSSYLTGNEAEFLAGLYSGRSTFTELLKGIKVEGGKSAFNSFVDIVRRLLGIGEDEMDAFTKALNLSEELISNKLDTFLVARDQIVYQAPGGPKAWLTQDPTAVRNGLDMLPVRSPAEEAEAKAMLSLWKKAEDANIQVDEKRLSKLYDNALFQGAQSTANTMLRSKNPVVRFVASMLLESPSGAAGRGATASIAKHLNEQAYLGTALNEVQDHFVQYRKRNGGNVAGDIFNGELKRKFDDEVAAEIEGRLPGRTAAISSQEAKNAANSIEQAYERMRAAQVNAKTIGWANLPANSKGYMPHKMNSELISRMTLEQRGIVHDALVTQFVNIEGFDLTFSHQLAAKYLDRVRSRALGGFEPAVGLHTPGAADIMEEAMQAAGMTANEIRLFRSKFQRGGAGHTKARLQLDLNAEHTLADGSTFRLRDVFITDQMSLLRSQASRVSGEVALARQGVFGKSGLNLLRRTMEYGSDGARATKAELEAFDQIAAEFMGDAYGTQSKMVDRAMQATSLARLGGMGFQQLGEAINGVFAVGAGRTIDTIASLGRLRKEAIALSQGKKVENSVLQGIEKFTGVDFGTEVYKTVFPFDNGSLAHQTYGAETLSMMDRLLRGGTHMQSKLSFWRAIHAAQQRGMAEQVVRKAAEYIRSGKNDVALRDMGITDSLAERLRKDMDVMASWDGDKLLNFDLTKTSDLGAAEEFAQSVHRGVSQIIQGTFIGETSAWSHSATMRIMTQFKSFGLTAVEKQWGRQVGNHGTAAALGMMLGSMGMVTPIYLARTYINSIGRDDRQAYLDRMLSPGQIARSSLNYIAQSGLAGDFLDLLSPITGIDPTGGKYGAKGVDFAGGIAAPAVGVVNDAYKAIQNNAEGTDAHQLVKVLPFSRLPFLQPAVNALGN